MLYMQLDRHQYFLKQSGIFLAADTLQNGLVKILLCIFKKQLCELIIYINYNSCIHALYLKIIASTVIFVVISILNMWNFICWFSMKTIFQLFPIQFLTLFAILSKNKICDIKKSVCISDIKKSKFSYKKMIFRYQEFRILIPKNTFLVSENIIFKLKKKERKKTP